MAKSKKRKVRIKYGKIFLFILLVVGTVFGIYKVINLRVTNIYITGNSIYTDQEIIDCWLT